MRRVRALAKRAYAVQLADRTRPHTPSVAMCEWLRPTSVMVLSASEHGPTGELTAIRRSRNLATSGDGVPPELPSKLMTPAVCVIAR